MKKKMKRFATLVAAACLLLGTLPLDAFAKENDETDSSDSDIVIIFTGELRGDVGPSAITVDMGKLATFYQETLKETPATILLDCGDTIQGDYFSNSNEGLATIEIMNAVGYSAMTLGSHDFDFGTQRLQELAQVANFPMLTQPTAYDEEDGFYHTTIIEIDDYKIGVFGLTTPEAQKAPGQEDVDFGDAATLVQLAKDAARSLRARGADIVICLSHIGDSADLEHDYGSVLDISKNVLGIDLIIDGQCATGLRTIDSYIPIAYSDTTRESVGVVRFIKIPTGFKVEISSLGYNEMAYYTSDSEVDTVIEKWTQNASAVSEQLVRVNEGPMLECIKAELRSGESPLGNLIADAMRDFTDADIAFVNSSAIQAYLPPGEIYSRDIYNMMPHYDGLFVAQVRGRVIWQALERAVEISLTTSTRSFIQVSGVSYTYIAGNPAGERVQSVTVNGEPINIERVYTLAATADLVKTSSDYEMLTAAFHTSSFVGNSADILLEYIADEENSLERGIENRIVKLLDNYGSSNPPKETDKGRTLLQVTFFAVLIVIAIMVRTKQREEKEKRGKSDET